MDETQIHSIATAAQKQGELLRFHFHLARWQQYLVESPLDSLVIACVLRTLA